MEYPHCYSQGPMGRSQHHRKSLKVVGFITRLRSNDHQWWLAGKKSEKNPGNMGYYVDEGWWGSISNVAYYLVIKHLAGGHRYFISKIGQASIEITRFKAAKRRCSSTWSAKKGASSENWVPQTHPVGHHVPVLYTHWNGYSTFNQTKQKIPFISVMNIPFRWGFP